MSKSFSSNCCHLIDCRLTLIKHKFIHWILFWLWYSFQHLCLIYSTRILSHVHLFLSLKTLVHYVTNIFIAKCRADTLLTPMSPGRTLRFPHGRVLTHAPLTFIPHPRASQTTQSQYPLVCQTEEYRIYLWKHGYMLRQLKMYILYIL